MAASGPRFYDDERVFKTYMAHRGRSDNPNDTLEEPDLLELVGAVANLRILDLGCGDARFGRQLLAAGCRGYTDVEASERMLLAANTPLTGTAGRVVRATIEGWEYPAGAFDLVVSRLALHYVEDLTTTFTRIFRTLTEGGRFVFSVEHPVITSCDRGWTTDRQRQDWTADDYFVTGRRETPWLGGEVVKYHRTIEDYFGGLLAAGFAVEALREAHPRRERFDDERTFDRRMRIPLFLLFSANR